MQSVYSRSLWEAIKSAVRKSTNPVQGPPGVPWLPKYHLDLVLAAVVGQGDKRRACNRFSVEKDPRHPAAHPIGVVHANSIVCVSESVVDLEVLPAPGYARIDAQK
jgi:hypothetical protein